MKNKYPKEIFCQIDEEEIDTDHGYLIANKYIDSFTVCVDRPEEIAVYKLVAVKKLAAKLED